MRKEFKEFEELQEFKNENVPKNAGSAEKSIGRVNSSVIHFQHSSTRSPDRSTDPLLHHSISSTDSCGVAARAGTVKNPTTGNLSPQ